MSAKAVTRAETHYALTQIGIVTLKLYLYDYLAIHIRTFDSYRRE